MVSGFIYRGEAAEAAYFVHWTSGQVLEHGAHFDLIVGKWGALASRTDRSALSLEFRVTENGPAFMVINASDRPVATHELVGNALRRDDVIGTPVAQLAFAIVDAIWLQDTRISEIVAASPA